MRIGWDTILGKVLATVCALLLGAIGGCIYGRYNNALLIEVTTTRQRDPTSVGDRCGTPQDLVVLHLGIQKAPSSRLLLDECTVEATAVPNHAVEELVLLAVERSLANQLEADLDAGESPGIALVPGDKVSYEAAASLPAKDTVHLKVTVGGHQLLGGVRIGHPHWTASAVSKSDTDALAGHGANEPASQ